jgi:hypothetical protein
MAVEYLQGELQRVTKTLDLGQSLVNGCDQEFLSGGPFPESRLLPNRLLSNSRGVDSLITLSRTLYQFPTPNLDTFFISLVHFWQKVHSYEQIIAVLFAGSAWRHFSHSGFISSAIQLLNEYGC